MKTLADLARLWDQANCGKVVVVHTKELNGVQTYTARSMEDYGVLIIPDGVKVLSCHSVKSRPRALFQIVE